MEFLCMLRMVYKLLRAGCTTPKDLNVLNDYRLARALVNLLAK